MLVGVLRIAPAPLLDSELDDPFAQRVPDERLALLEGLARGELGARI